MNTILSYGKRTMEGVKIIKSNRLISTMIGLGTIINFSAVPLFGIGLIYILKEVLKVDDMQFGFFQMVLSSSMLLAPLLCGVIIKKIRIGRLTYSCFIITALLVLLMSIFTSSIILKTFDSNVVSYLGILITSFMVGLVVTVSNIALGTIFNQVVPLDLMGRTSTVYNLAVTVFIPVGQMIFGFLYDIISPGLVVIFSGIILFIATSLYKKALLSYDDIDLEVELKPMIN